MKPRFWRFFLSIFLFSGATSAAWSQSPDSQVPLPSFPQTYAEFQKNTPRVEGSPAEMQTIDRLQNFFQAQGFAVERTEYDDLVAAHSFSASLSFSVEGKSPDRLVIVVPVETQGSETNNAGLSWAKLWAASLKDKKPELSLTFLFLGAERGLSGNSALGSKHFLEDFFPKERCVVLYLDCSVSTREVDLVLESGSYITPIWLSQAFLDGLTEAGFTPNLVGTHPRIFRFDLPEKQTLAHPWFQRNFPVVTIKSRANTTNKVVDTQSEFENAMNGFLSKYASGFPATWDRHYLYFELFSFQFFFSQRIYLLLLVIILGASILLFLFFLPGIKEDLISVSKSIWQLPVYFFFLFLFLTTATFAINTILDLREFNSLRDLAPLPILAMKIAASLMLYFLVFLQIRRMPLSRWPRFYSYSAVLCLGFEVLIAASIELSFSFYFLWAFFFSVVFHLLPTRRLKLVAFLIAPVWFVKAALEVFWLAPDPVLIKLAVSSLLGGNLAIAGILFPFLLLVNSFHYLRHQIQERNEKQRSQVILMGWALATAALSLVLLRYNPFGESDVPLEVHETLDTATRTRVLDVQSPVPWQPMNLTWGNQSLPIAAGFGEIQKTLSFQNSVWTTQVRRSSFLGRYIWTMNFTSPAQLESLQLNLESERLLVVYGCNFPYQLDANGKSAQIFVGRFPPQSLELKLTLSEDSIAKLKITAQFHQFPFSVGVSDKKFRLNPQLTVEDEQVIAPWRSE